MVMQQGRASLEKWGYMEWNSKYWEWYMQAEFQCSYSLQLLLGNQQQILTVHFHVYSFAFPLGRVLVLLHRLAEEKVS